MQQTAFFKKLKQEHLSKQAARRKIAEQASAALNRSKQAIFAMHRDDRTVAMERLGEAVKLFESCEALVKKNAELALEGAYRAALEEYAEARLFERYLDKRTIGAVDKRVAASDLYIAGLCDCAGELVRFAMRQITKSHPEEAEQARATVEFIVDRLLELDLTGYLRTKFDQTKKHLQRLEEIVFELTLRRSL